jgi:hypothetical protein
MLGFIRRLFFGMSAGITGLAFLLIKLLGLALHIYTIYFAYVIKGFLAALITFFMPLISQIFWVFNSVGMFGKWINPFSFYVGLYVILAIILWVIVIIFGAAAGASYKDD